MKNKRHFALLSSLPLIISGCFGYSGSVNAIKNGDIASSDISSDNAYRYVDFKTLDNLIKSNSEFIFYLSSTTCTSCQEFEPIMVNYIQNTHQLVYKMNADTQFEDFQQLYNTYADYFNGLSYTPGIYIFGDGAGSYQISNSRISNLNMFTTAMKEKVYESNVYSISNFSSLDSYLGMQNRSYLLFYDRSNSEYANYYNSYLKESVNKFDKNIIIVELSQFSDKDLESVKSLLNIEKIEPIMYSTMLGKKLDYHVVTNIDEIKNTMSLKFE